jgi:hypothetical protein
MATVGKEQGDYKSVALEEEDIVEMRKAVATGSAKSEATVSSGAPSCFLCCHIPLELSPMQYHQLCAIASRQSS